MPEAHETLMEILARARGALQGHAGHRVHDRGRAALHAADAQRQAPGAGRRALRVSTRSTRGCCPRRRRSPTIDAEPLDALLHPTFDPKAEFEVLASGVAASPGAAKGEIVFTAEEAVAGRAGRARRHPRAAVHRGRRRRRASTPPRGSSRARAARPRTRRWSRAGWGARRWSARATLEDRPRRRGRSRVDGTTVDEGDLIAIDGTTGVRDRWTTSR